MTQPNSLFQTNKMTSSQLAYNSSVGEALHQYHRGHGFNSCIALNSFPDLIFTAASEVFITAKIALMFMF